MSTVPTSPSQLYAATAVAAATTTSAYEALRCCMHTREYPRLVNRIHSCIGRLEAYSVARVAIEAGPVRRSPSLYYTRGNVGGVFAGSTPDTLHTSDLVRGYMGSEDSSRAFDYPVTPISAKRPCSFSSPRRAWLAATPCRSLPRTSSQGIPTALTIAVVRRCLAQTAHLVAIPEIDVDLVLFPRCRRPHLRRRSTSLLLLPGRDPPSAPVDTSRQT